jgi:amino acid transporter
MYFPGLPVEAVAIIIVCFFSFVNLCGIKWVARLAIPMATASASLAFVSALAPMIGGDVSWTEAFDYHLTTPFEGWFGNLTSIMAGLYLIGFAAPAFEAAACHVGETVESEPQRASCHARRRRHGRGVFHGSSGGLARGAWP